MGQNEPIFGQMKFEYGSLTGNCNKEDKVPNWDYTNWDPNKWYHIELEFDTGYGRLIIDGKEMLTLQINQSCPAVYRYLYIPIKWCVSSIEGVNESVYAYASFAGYTKNQNVDAGYEITDIVPPDAGESFITIPVLEDHSVHKWEPDIHPEDYTVLDVEGDENGNFNEGFYLKFKVDSVPQGYEVDEAWVFLYCDYPKYPNAAEGGGGDIYFVPNNNWSENSITWNNKPPFSSQKIDSQGIIKRGNWYRFDVSSIVKGNGVYSFAVMSSYNDGGHYLSKEGGASNGQVPYIRLHLVKSSSNDTVADIGYEDYNYEDNTCFLCDDLIIPDDGNKDNIALDEFNLDDTYPSNDELIYPDEYSEGGGTTDISLLDVLSDSKGVENRGASEESAGCNCTLVE